MSRWLFALFVALSLSAPALAQESMTEPHICRSHVTINPSTATDTNLVAPVAGKSVFLCDYNFSVGIATNTFFLESNTGNSSCTGGTLTQIDTQWVAAANALKPSANPWYQGLFVGAGVGVCLHTTAAAAMSFTLYYDQI